MMNLLKKLAYYTRGVFYLFLYHIPYQVMLPEKVRLHEQVKTVVIGDAAYKLRLNIDEGGLAEDIYICGVREYPNVYYFKDYAKGIAGSLDSYIDVGANIGYYVLLAHRLFNIVHSHTNVYAVEPVKSTYRRLLENIRLNKMHNMKTYNVGIGDKDTLADIVVMKPKNLSIIQDSSTVKVGKVEKIVKIQVLSLKTFFHQNRIPPKNVFLRCDIEGYEYKLIVGNIKFLSSLKNAHIVMEFHPFYLHAKKSVELLSMLQNAGYKLDQVVSCEVAYFLRMPKIIRNFLIKLFLFQYDGDAMGKIRRYRNIDDLIRDIRHEQNILYVYPNLHFYFSKK